MNADRHLRGSTFANSSIVQSLVDQNMLLLPATFDQQHLGGVGPLNHRFLYGSHPDNPPPLDTYSHCHLSFNTETLITRATGPAALVGLLPAAK
jgi:hypothetical protein